MYTTLIQSIFHLSHDDVTTIDNTEGFPINDAAFDVQNTVIFTEGL